MRARLYRNGQLQEAQKKGLCQCWPFDTARNEDVKPIKRVAPRLPAQAFQSGFSIVEFDLKDDGSTQNFKMLESWPKDIFEKASERAVLKWKYSPRMENETDADRTGIIATVRYSISNDQSKLIEIF